MPRSTDWRELRRLQAWSLHQRGWSQRRIAQYLGVSQGAVSRWFKQVREGGSADTLRRHPAPGKQPLLTDEQFAQLPVLIARGPEAFGLRAGRWTTRCVAEVIRQTFGISYHPGHVSRLLQKYCPGWRRKGTPIKEDPNS